MQGRLDCSIQRTGRKPLLWPFRSRREGPHADASHEEPYCPDQAAHLLKPIGQLVEANEQDRETDGRQERVGGNGEFHRPEEIGPISQEWFPVTDRFLPFLPGIRRGATGTYY